MPKSTNPLNIAFVLDDGLDRPDGVQQYILTLGKWLRGRGHHVDYLVGHTSRSDILGMYSLAHNVGVKFNGNNLSVPLPARGRAIKNVLHENVYDILHVQVPYSPLFAGKTIRLAAPRTTVVGTFHILPYGKLSKFGSGLLRKLLWRSIDKFSGHISVSSAAQKFASQYYGIESSVIPNAVDLSRFKVKKHPAKSKKLKIVFLGRLVERKGCRLLLEAIEQLKDEKNIPDFEVAICGDGPLRLPLTKYVQTHGLEKHVRFYGFISEESKRKHLSSADIAVFPSLAGESFGIVLLEAMAAGAGVTLGGNNPGYSSVLGDCPESLLDVSDKKKFKQKLRVYMKNPQKRKGLHKKQMKLVKKYDVEVVGPQILKFYRNCKKIKIDR